MTTMNPQESNTRFSEPYFNYTTEVRYLGEKNGPSPVVYICARHAGRTEQETRENVEKIRRYAGFVGAVNAIPVATVLFEPELGSEEAIDYECELRSYYAYSLIHRCDELWMFVEDGISEGMALELAEACHCGLRIRYFNKSFKEVCVNESRH